MRIRVPFIYTAQMKKRGNKVIRDINLLGETSVDVPEYTSSDAQVAAELTLTLKDEYDRENYPKTIRYHTTPKGLVKPFTLELDKDSAWRRTPPVSVEQLPEMLNEWKQSVLLKTKGLNYELIKNKMHRTKNPFMVSRNLIYFRHNGEIKRECELDVKLERFGSNREHVENEIIEFASRAAVIDGFLYQVSGGPFLEIINCNVMNANRQAEKFIAIRANPERLEAMPLRDNVNTFPCDQMPNALARAQQLRKNEGIEKDVEYVNTVRIYMPQAFGVIFDREKILDASKDLLRSHRADLWELPVSTIMLYAQFKQLVQDIKSTAYPSNEQIDKLLISSVDFHRSFMEYRGAAERADQGNPLMPWIEKRLGKEDTAESDEDTVQFSELDLDDLEPALKM